MYGKYNLEIQTPDGSVEFVEKCNHLTRRGLSFILKGDPKLNHAGLVGPTFDNFKKRLNFMFLYIKQEGQELRVKDEDIFAMEFPDLNDPYIRYVDKGYSRYSDIYSFEGKESVTIEGIGIGYKEVGGTGENDFIFSYTNLGIDPTNYRTNVINATNYNNVVMPGWSVNVNYDFRPAVDALPNIKVDIGGVLHTLINTTFDSAGYWGDDRYGVGLFNQTIPVAQSPVNVSGMKATFEWAINGLPLVPASLFEELVVTDETSRQLSRVFKVQYHNKRDFAVHVTGFKLIIGDIPFAYRTSADNAIILPPGKTLTLTLSAEIFLGKLPLVDTSTFNTIDTTITRSDKFEIDPLSFSEYIQTRYPGTNKEQVTIKKIDNSYIYFSGPTDALTKYVFKTFDGRMSKPYYILGTTAPSSYSFSAPALTNVDGWVVNNDDVVFRITAPSGVTHIEFALSDNVWTRYAVTTGAVNFIKLPSRFLYAGTKYLRWANAVSTGLITKHTAKYLSDNNVLPVEYVYGDSKNPYLVGYATRIEADLPIGYTDATTYVEGTTVLTKLTGGVVDSFATEAGIDLNKNAVLSGGNTKFVGPILNSKWFDAVNMKLVTVAKMDSVVSIDKHDSTKPGGLVETNYKINPTSSSTLVTTKISAYPKVTSTATYKSPTVAKPNKITGHLSAKAYGIELYNSITNEVLATFTGKPSSEYVLTTTAMMYTHVAYGLRYVDEVGQNISAAQEHFIYGVALAAPDLPPDVVYDRDLNLLTFTTPDRATRATISRWGIELYSFECVIGGVTSLYSSETFVATGNYVLTLLNTENTKSQPHYLFGVNDDPAIKPDITGPYNFNDWTYNSNNYTNSTDLPFAQPAWYEQGLYKLRIDGQFARVASISRNPSNLITSVLFESNGSMLLWNTGYSETDTDYNKASYTSSIRLIKHNGNGYCIVELWHEFGLYSEIGIDKIGVNRPNGWTGSFGKNTNWYQFTDISNGYIRNSLKLLLGPNTNDSLRVPFEHDTSFIAKTPYANIYPHTTDMQGSPNYDPARNYYPFTGWETYINGVKGEFETTLAEDGITIIKIRAFTPEVALVLDMDNKAAGWLLEGFDPLKVGDPEFKDIAINFELHYTNKWSYTSYVGQYPNSSGYDYNATSPVRVKSSYYLDQIYTKFYPYMTLPTISEVMGTPVENIGYNTYTEATNQLRNRWAEAFLPGNLANELDNSSVVINGVLATVTTEEVTIPFDSSKNNLISQYQYEKPVESGAYNNVIQPVLGDYTYTAVTFSIPGLVLSNKKHSQILQVESNTLSNPDVEITIVIVRNKALQPPYGFDYYSRTNNVQINESISASPYYFSYVVVNLYPTYPPIMRGLNAQGTYDFLPESVPSVIISSLYILANAVKGVMDNEGFVVPENNTISDTVQVDGVLFDIVIDPTYIAYSQDQVNNPLPTSAFKLTNADNTKEIVFGPFNSVEYIGFEKDVSIEIVVGLFTDDANNDIVTVINNFYTNVGDSPAGNLYMLQNQVPLGYNRSSFWNYIPHTVASGQQGIKVSLKTKLLAETVYNADFVVPDRTEEILSRYSTNFNTEFKYTLNPEFMKKWTVVEGIPELTMLNDTVSFYCNGVKSSPAVWYMDETNKPIYVSIKFESLGLAIYISPNNDLGLWDLVTDSDLVRDDLYIFTIESKGLSLTANDSPFVINIDAKDTATYGVFDKSSGFYTDVNGTSRIETLYMVYGTKPYVEYPIDERIGASPFPTFGRGSFVYLTNSSSSNNEEG
jgi:hypothetical protein